MTNRYDSRTTQFSPEGRLHQVEYALEAINRAGACVSVVCKDAIVFACEKRPIHELMNPKYGHEKFFRINDQIICAVAGVYADAHVMISHMREICQYYLKKFQEHMPIEQLVTRVCDIKQEYTQVGGHRPFGVSIIFMGYDENNGFEIFQSDPSGNYSGWLATCIGKNSNKSMQKLKTDYKKDMSVDDGIQICLKILQEALETDIINSKNVLSEERVLSIPGNRVESSSTSG